MCNDVNSMDRVKVLLLLECNDIVICLICYCNVYMGYKLWNFVVIKFCFYMVDCNWIVVCDSIMNWFKKRFRFVYIFYIFS